MNHYYRSEYCSSQSVETPKRIGSLSLAPRVAVCSQVEREGAFVEKEVVAVCDICDKPIYSGERCVLYESGSMVICKECFQKEFQLAEKFRFNGEFEVFGGVTNG